MSLAARIKESFEHAATQKQSKSKKPLELTTQNIKRIKKRCVALNQDFTVLITGREGSGKSTLASHVVKLFEPGFSIKEGMIYSLKGETDSLVGFMDRFKDIPFKATWYDEAVSVLFSLRHSTKDSADAQELFKIKRESRHFDILVTPSFWDLVPYIRERRVQVVLYCFYTPLPMKNCGERHYKYQVACFGPQKVPFLSINKKVKLSFGSPDLLFEHVKPDYIEDFPPMDEKFSIEYINSKHAHRDDVLNSIRETPIGRREKRGGECVSYE